MPTLTADAVVATPFRIDQADALSDRQASGVLDQLLREWPRVCGSPANRRLLLRWQRQEPVLAGPAGLNELLQTIDVSSRDLQDQMLHALIRLAQQGHQMAARTLLQAMLPKLTKLSRSRSQVLSDDGIQMVLGHFWEVVHHYPLHRTQSVAANLALGTLNRVTRERNAGRTELPEEHASLEAKHPTVGDPMDEIAGQLHCDMDLMELLAWALDHKVLSNRQASLLARVYLREPDQTSEDIADQMGITVQALRSRCARAVPHLTRAVAQDLAISLSD